LGGSEERKPNGGTPFDYIHIRTPSYLGVGGAFPPARERCKDKKKRGLVVEPWKTRIRRKLRTEAHAEGAGPRGTCLQIIKRSSKKTQEGGIFRKKGKRHRKLVSEVSAPMPGGGDKSRSWRRRSESGVLWEKGGHGWGKGSKKEKKKKGNRHQKAVTCNPREALGKGRIRKLSCAERLVQKIRTQQDNRERSLSADGVG